MSAKITDGKHPKKLYADFETGSRQSAQRKNFTLGCPAICGNPPPGRLSPDCVRGVAGRFQCHHSQYHGGIGGGGVPLSTAYFRRAIPTDKAYRYYVDYLANVQKMAAKERERIEEAYDARVSEVDNMMAQTSRLLAMLSGAAGFVYTSNVQEQRVQRLDFIPLAPGAVLAVLVTESGAVRHWPVRTGYVVSPTKLRVLSRFINEEIEGRTLAQARQILWQHVHSGHREIADMADLATQVLKDMERPQATNELYVEGFGQLLENTSQDDFEDLKQMMRFVEERERFSNLLSEKMTGMEKANQKLNVSIGSENELKELKNLSIVSTACKVGDKTVGMLGIIGPKHMEYTRVMSLVNFIGSLLESTLQNWTALPQPNDEEDYE